jgi:ATP-dependent Clp protease adapter protein ClpS
MAARVGTRRVSIACQITPIPKKPRMRYPDLTNDVPPHYKVMLHKDDNFVHKHVSKVLSEVIIDMSLTEANDKATEAYLKGKSLLRVCPEDVAKIYCSEIINNKVSATIEPVDFF